MMETPLLERAVALIRELALTMQCRYTVVIELVMDRMEAAEDGFSLDQVVEELKAAGYRTLPDDLLPWFPQAQMLTFVEFVEAARRALVRQALEVQVTASLKISRAPDGSAVMGAGS